MTGEICRFSECFNDHFRIIDFITVNYLTPPTRSREFEQWNMSVDMGTDAHNVFSCSLLSGKKFCKQNVLNFVQSRQHAEHGLKSMVIAFHNVHTAPCAVSVVHLSLLICYWGS